MRSTSGRAKRRAELMVAGALAIAACVDGPRAEPLDPAARRAACVAACADGRCGGPDCVVACDRWLRRWRDEWAGAWAAGAEAEPAPPPVTAALEATWATCRRAPRCPLAIACDDPRWPWLTDGVLDEIGACLLGPCEARAGCLADALPADGVCDGAQGWSE